MRERGPFKEIHRSVKYRSDWMRLEEAAVIRPDGSSGSFGLVYMRPGATVVAVDESGNIILAREYKYALEKETVELISGGIEDGETPEEAAGRELMEETGYISRSIIRLGEVDPFTTVVSSKNYILLARDLVFDPGAKDSRELIESFSVPLADAVGMVERSEITHAASCVGILLAARLLPKSL